MDEHDFKLVNTLSFVKSLLVDVGEQLKSRFVSREDLKIIQKDDGDLVTSADLEADKTIKRELKRQYPYIDIYSEEDAIAPAVRTKVSKLGFEENTASLVWVVDPLDGTVNFIANNSFWNVSVSLVDLDTGQVLLGVTYAPMYNKMYYAIHGKGAFVNGKRLDISHPSGAGREGGHKRDAQYAPRINAFCYGKGQGPKDRAFEYAYKMVKKGVVCRQWGAAQLELAYIAEGYIDTMFIPGANLYDVATGVLLIQEAGGIVEDEEGLSWGYMGHIKDVWAGRYIEYVQVIKKIEAG